MSLINVTNLSFAYDGSYDDIFENISFQIDTDWKLGFIGRNGRGKTTFLNLLLNKYFYSGVISSSCNFVYFPYEIPNKSLITNEIIYKICPNYQEWELSRELSLLELREDILTRPFETLSNGEQTKILLAALFLNENGYLLIDEPTNHLDISARRTVGKYLKSKKGFILVSHDRSFLDACIDHILSINKNDIEIQKGNFSSWLENKKRRDSFELSENEKLKKEIKRLSSSAKRTSSWSDSVEKTKYNTTNSGSSIDRGYLGHKSAKMMKRSKSIEQRTQAAIQDKSKLLKNTEDADNLKIHTLTYHANRLISIEKLSLFYEERQVCGEISFCVERGDRIALGGKNGSGKSSLIKLICGEDIIYTGSIQKGSGLVLSYVSQDTAHLTGSLTCFADSNGIEESLFKTILKKLDFSRIQFEKDITTFSEGQKKKVLLAKSLCEKAHLLLWDEPLNFIDVISRMQIEELLLDFKPTILFVEHDRVFCDKIATKRVEIT